MFTRQMAAVKVGVCALLAGALVSGCVKNKVLIKVKPDGSGNIVVTRFFSKEMVTMFKTQMDEMKKKMGGMEGAAAVEMANKDPFYDEKAIEREAGQYGPGVTFVKAEKVDQEGGRGFVAIYAFKDINSVFVNVKSLGPEASGRGMGGSDGEIPVAEKGEDAYSFKLAKGPVNTLKILVPDFPEPVDVPEAEGAAGAKAKPAPVPGQRPMGGPASPEMQGMMAGGNPFGLTGNETQEEIVKKMFKGMYMDLAVEVVGTEVKGNASHAVPDKKNRFVLYRMDMDKMMSSPKMMSLMNGGGGMRPGGPLDGFAAMKNMPGVTVETNKAVTISFK